MIRPLQWRDSLDLPRVLAELRDLSVLRPAGRTEARLDKTLRLDRLRAIDDLDRFLDEAEIPGSG